VFSEKLSTSIQTVSNHIFLKNTSVISELRLTESKKTTFQVIAYSAFPFLKVAVKVVIASKIRNIE